MFSVLWLVYSLHIMLLRMSWGLWDVVFVVLHHPTVPLSCFRISSVLLHPSFSPPSAFPQSFLNFPSIFHQSSLNLPSTFPATFPQPSPHHSLNLSLNLSSTFPQPFLIFPQPFLYFTSSFLQSSFNIQQRLKKKQQLP